MRSLVTITLLSAAVFTAISSANANEDAYLQELTAAGISQETADGIVAIAEKAKDKSNDPNETGKTIFEAIVSETDAYMKGRSDADQQAYAKLVADKKAQYENPTAIDLSNAVPDSEVPDVPEPDDSE